MQSGLHYHKHVAREAELASYMKLLEQFGRPFICMLNSVHKYIIIYKHSPLYKI